MTSMWARSGYIGILSNRQGVTKTTCGGVVHNSRLAPRGPGGASAPSMPAGVRAALLRLKELAGLGGCCPSGAVRACCCRLCTSSAKVEAAPGSGEYAGAPPLPSNEDGSMLPMPSMSSSLLVICGERTWCALGLGLGLGLGVRG